MTWSVGIPIRAGDHDCFAIAETRISATAKSHRVAAYCEKRPVLILVSFLDTWAGMDLKGRPITREEIDARFPGAIEQAKARISRLHGSNPGVGES